MSLILRGGGQGIYCAGGSIQVWGFGSGLSPMAPGTCGTLWAWGVYWLLHSRLDHIALGIVIVVTLLLGW